jgi:DNA-binding transcriptional ArsR family regulator
MQEEDTPLDEILSSRGRTRILMLLSDAVELNITEIAKSTGLNHSTTRGHLEHLEKIGLVEQKRFGRIRIYKYQETDPRAQALKTLIKVWNDENNRGKVGF